MSDTKQSNTRVELVTNLWRVDDHIALISDDGDELMTWDVDDVAADATALAELSDGELADVRYAMFTAWREECAEWGDPEWEDLRNHSAPGEHRLLSDAVADAIEADSDNLSDDERYELERCDPDSLITGRDSIALSVEVHPGLWTDNEYFEWGTIDSTAYEAAKSGAA